MMNGLNESEHTAVASDVADGSEPAGSCAGKGGRVESVRVLIVEDELILAMDLEDLLIEAGHEVVGLAADMHQALAIAERDMPDLAIMDVNLARGTNGIDTARLLRERYDVPSLFVSGNLDPKTRAIVAAFEPVGFVPKPISQAEFLNALSKVA